MSIFFILIFHFITYRWQIHNNILNNPISHSKYFINQIILYSLLQNKKLIAYKFQLQVLFQHQFIKNKKLNICLQKNYQSLTMQESWKNNKSSLKNKVNTNENQDYYDEEFQSQKKIQHQQKISLPKLENKSKVLKNKAQNADEEYQNDFEGTEKNISTSVKNSKIEEKKKLPKAAKDQRKTQKSNNKEKNIDKQPRNSLGVEQAQRENNKYSKSNQKVGQNSLPSNPFSKYSTSLQKQFPYEKQQLMSFNQDKINRLNQKLRNYITKVNNELTDILNVNMMKLKVKKVQKSPDIQKQISLLNQLKKSNSIALQTTQKQIKNYLQKSQKFSQQEYEIMIYHEANEIKTKIKDLSREIVDMQKGVKVDGNKLAEENNTAQKINEVKNHNVQAKKQEQRNQNKITKLDTTFEELTLKNAEIDKILAKLTQQAKINKIKLNIGTQDKKKQEQLAQLKKKIQSLKSHKNKVGQNTQKKTQIATYDNEILIANIKQHTQKFEQFKAQIQNIQSRSMQLIIQAKSKKNLAPHIEAHLDFVYKMMEEGAVMENTSYLQTKNRQTNSKMLRKYGSVANTNKAAFGRSQSQSQNLVKTKFLVSKKPQLLVRKKQQTESAHINTKVTETQVQKRIWKQTHKDKVQDQLKIVAKQQKKQPLKKQQIIIPENKSKPFSIKRKDKEQSKAQLKQKDEKIISSANVNSNQSQKQNNIEKIQKSPSLGPKSIKFNKNKEEVHHEQPVIREQSPNQEKPNNIDKNLNISIEQRLQNKNLQKRESINNAKPKMRIKKASKQKIQIPSQDLYMFPIDKKVDNVKYIATQSDVHKSVKGQIKNQKKPEEQSPPAQQINFGNRRAQQRKIKKKEQQQTYV